LAVVATVAGTSMAVPSAQAATTMVAERHRPALRPLPGHWHAIGSDGVNTIDNDVHFYASHTLAIDFPGRNYQGTGLWTEDRSGALSFYQQHPDYNEAGQLVGWTRADISGRQSGPDTISGSGPVRSYDLTGNVTLTLQVTFDATRLPS